MQVVSREEALEHVRVLLDQLLAVCNAIHMRTLADLRAYLLDAGGRSWGPIPRSALHILLSNRGTVGSTPSPPWGPSTTMLSAELGLPPAKLLPAEAASFLSKALQVVCAPWSDVGEACMPAYLTHKLAETAAAKRESSSDGAEVCNLLKGLP